MSTEGLQSAGLGRVALAVSAVGVPGALVAVGADPSAARAAAAQDWPPFVLVAGLLLVGMVASADGVFEAAGATLARTTTRGAGLFAGSVVVVAVVTAVLNLDTSVAFLTPVLVAAARAHAPGERPGDLVEDGNWTARAGLVAPLVVGCLLLSNAASLLLPGSNLTNLIVLGHLQLSGARFAGRTAMATVVAVAVTAVVVAAAHRQALGAAVGVPHPRSSIRAPRLLGIGAVGAATSAVVVLRQPALSVLVVGALSVLLRFGVAGRRFDARRLARKAGDAVGGPILVGLLGVAVAAGTLGRAWSGPGWLLAHAGTWGNAALGAVVSVGGNNLPAASLLAARRPPHPFALLVGLDVGPNLFVTGSLSSLLWWRAVRSAGARPSIAHLTRVGVVAAPLAGAAALAVLVATGSH